MTEHDPTDHQLALAWVIASADNIHRALVALRDVQAVERSRGMHIEDSDTVQLAHVLSAGAMRDLAVERWCTEQGRVPAEPEELDLVVNDVRQFITDNVEAFNAWLSRQGGMTPNEVLGTTERARTGS